MDALGLATDVDKVSVGTAVPATDVVVSAGIANTL